MTRWRPLIVLAATQFLMVLDASVMNVSISQLVADFDTTVSTIQGVITFYSLVMAALMVTGGKLGEIFGPRRTLVIGMVIYAAGSGLTAASWNVASLAFGWSVLEGIGAAMVMPAMAALVAANYQGSARVTAYGVLGGVAGAGIAVGPILGGWATTALTWRIVFAGEVVIAIAIVATHRWIVEAPAPARRPKLDLVGAVLCAVGLSVTVFALLQASTWGWLQPINSPVEPLGFALTPFVVGLGIAIIYGFFQWIQHRSAKGLDPLVRPETFAIAPLRSGLWTFLAQNTILMGVFFALPLYLQIVLGLDALETGVRMLPTSIFMLVVSFSGALLVKLASPRTIVRAGLGLLMVTALVLAGTIEPTLRGTAFAIGMAMLGAGMGLMVSQLGNIVQSSVPAESRSEAGGLQYTSQQLGSSIGVALIGSIVLTSLSGAYLRQIADDDRISSETASAVEVRLASGSSFIPSDQAEAAAREAGLPDAEVQALVEDYEEAQLQALRSGLLAVVAIAGAAFLVTGNLPSRRPYDDDAPPGADAEAAAAAGAPA
jgi:EmrB/QacA subfamily drug resistance transporter